MKHSNPRRMRRESEGGGSAKKTKLDLEDPPTKPTDFLGLMKTLHEEHEARQAAKDEAQRRAREEAKAAWLVEQQTASGKLAAAGVATGSNTNLAPADTTTRTSEAKKKRKRKKKTKKAPGGGENAGDKDVTGGNTEVPADIAKSEAKTIPVASGGGHGDLVHSDTTTRTSEAKKKRKRKKTKKAPGGGENATGGNTEVPADIAKSEAKTIPVASGGGHGGAGNNPPNDPLLVYHRLDPGTVSNETYLGFLQTDHKPPVKMYGTRKQGFYVARQLIARLNAGQIYEGDRHLEDNPAVIPGLDGKEWKTYGVTKEQMCDTKWKEVVSSAKPSFSLEQAVHRSLKGHPDLRTRFKRSKCTSANFHHMVWKINCHYSFDTTRRLVTIDRGTGANAGCFDFPKDSMPYKNLFKLIVSTDADNLKSIRDTANAYGISE